MLPEQMTVVCPKAVSWVDPLSLAFGRWQVDTPIRQAAALAQFSYESSCFSRVEEDLYYSTEGLLREFHSHFKDFADAQTYAKQPERIANRVYCNRFGNGDETSGDGWKYRGRGPTQLTFKSNYTRASLAIYGDDRLVTSPELVALPQVGAEVAGWFWSSHQLSKYADLNTAEGFRKITILIQGSDASNPQRVLLWTKFRKAFGLSII
jgi:putative chitinase